MNPRQRRGALLVALSLVGAALVFASVTRYVGNVADQVGELSTVVRLTADVQAFAAVPGSAVEIVEVPARWRPTLALESAAAIGQRVPAIDLPAGTVLQEGDLVDPPAISEGMRELAILVDAETAAAGKIGVGDTVDVIATRPGAEAEPPRAEVVVEAARILSIGLPVLDDQLDAGGQFQSGEVVPVTFLLTPDDVLRLAWIESFATTVRLALRAPTDDAGLEVDQRLYQPDSGAARTS